MLVNLGLKQTRGIHGFLDSAKSVSMLHDKMEPEVVVNGKRLLGCLDALALKFSTEEVEFSFNEFGPDDEVDNSSRNTPMHFMKIM